MAMGVDAGLLEGARARRVQLAVGERLERDLRRVVAVLLLGAQAEDPARAGLEHRDRGNGPVLVEQLAHAQLAGEQAFHLALDLDAHARREREPLQRVDDARVEVEDVDHALVRAHLELLAGILVDERRPDHRELADLSRQRDGAGSARVRAAGGVDDLVRRLVQDPMVVGLEPDPDFLRHCLSLSLPSAYLTTSVATPEPTVLPPSRIAKRRPGSMAIGSPRVISMTTLSPGMVISTPSGSLTSPVTSVVRM